MLLGSPALTLSAEALEATFPVILYWNPGTISVPKFLESGII